MPYCPKCLVELAPQAKICPLCSSLPVGSLQKDHGKFPPVPAVPPSVSFPEDVHHAEEREKFSPSEFRMVIIELLSVSIGIVLIVTLFIDVVFMHGITWSRYSSLSLIIIWLCTAIPLLLWGHPWLIYAVLGPSTLFAVFLWFTVSGHIGIFPVTGLPITVMAEVSVIVSGVLIAAQNRRGLNAVGVVLAAFSLFCAGIDLIITHFLNGTFFIGWSIVVLMSAIPVSGFFFYLHYRVTNRASLRKIFRL